MNHVPPLFAASAAIVFFSSAFDVSASGTDSGTAYEALRAVGSALGHGAQNRVVEISGRGGRPQPSTWLVRLEEESGRAGGVDVDVKGRKVTAQRKTKVGAGGRLSLASIQLDSDGVFAIANAEAVRCDISFDRLNYRLRAQGGYPVWSVELFDGPTALVGTLKISADNGSVMERSSSLALSEQEKREERWSKPGEKFKSVPDFFHRAGKKIERTGYQLRNWASGDGWTDEKNP